MTRSSGVILWEGPSPIDGAPIVAIATGLVRASKNVKTGEMIQVFIVRQDVHPVEAYVTGADVAICGACPLRAWSPAGVAQPRVCYVEVGKSVTAVWRAYVSGSYPRVSPSEARALFAGRAVRLGAYGDPAMVPYDVLAESVADASLWTGYTHQWRTTDPRWAGLIMASCDSPSDLTLARAQGWRGFVVMPIGVERPAGTVECANTRDKNPLQCLDCGMCAGTRLGAASRAVSVAITAHGPGKGFVMATS